MVGIVDYGVGNLFSLKSSLAHLGIEATVSGDAAVLRQAQRLILPGVGAFGDAAQKLRQSGLDRLVQDAAACGTPVMGICLGMQLLFERSSEFGDHAGLGLLPGQVQALRPALDETLKTPHMGWNALEFVQPAHPLLRKLHEGDFVYFVHSFYATHCQSVTVAQAEYGIRVPALVARGNVCGCQFHPEKSGETGLAILRAFCETEDGLC